ncbi:MAG: Glutamate--tRNA ligase [Lentisphaerae bacterium ADurb.Bin242]|nr:MAG: Glutamate--tRNA ligase [Lentisphaerae bacterium ADurb.Bin242]
MDFRARFAPSPTGQVHIGNIRTAIFNWLYTRHSGGEFLLRIEDTDLERSTKQAIDALFDCMNWLGLDYDGEPMYQTSQSEVHREAARTLIRAGYAYRLNPAEEASPVLFRLPFDCDSFPFVRTIGEVRIDTAPGQPVSISRAGLVWSVVNHKGTTVECAAGLAGFKNLKVFAADNSLLFALDASRLEELSARIEPEILENAASFTFTRREVFFHDLVKGELSKPLDSIKDFIIIRSDSSPVFHLANVCDDVTQKITHIVRGDDHVENTYRHLFLFQALGFPVPAYAHLPMLVNASGKPYSKRDGDAFVGDYREKGFLPEAFFNYLSLLGWSPGDNREKMSRAELIEAFSIDRAQRSPAQFDLAKLVNLNGLYIAEMPPEQFEAAVWDFAARWPWRAKASRELFKKVAALMQSRTKTTMDAQAWEYFFVDDFPRDPKASGKFLKEANVRKALTDLADLFEKEAPASAVEIEFAIRSVETVYGIAQGKLNQPFRVALTGITVGAGMYETAELLGAAKCCARIRRALAEPGA